MQEQQLHVDESSSRRKPLAKINTHPVRVRLDAMATVVPDADGKDEGTSWTEVLEKIHGLKFMRRADNRAAGERTIVELVDTSGCHLDKPYFVDAGGMLRRRVAVPEPSTMSTDDIAAYIDERVKPWLDGRKVGGEGKALYWFVPTGATKRKFRERCQKTGQALLDQVPTFRQGNRLSPEETETFAGFPDPVREKLLADSPRR